MSVGSWRADRQVIGCSKADSQHGMWYGARAPCGRGLSAPKGLVGPWRADRTQSARLCYRPNNDLESCSCCTSTTKGNFIVFIAIWTNPHQHFEFLISANSQRQPYLRCLGTTPETLILQWLGSTCRKLCTQPNISPCLMFNGLLTAVSTYWNWLISTPESQ